MPTGHSLELPVSEEPFLRRELGLDWVTVTADQLRERLGRGERSVIICSEPAAYRELLAEAPARSVVLVLISDEGYSAERCDMVLASPSVISVYRQYAAAPAGAAQVARAVRGFIGDARSTSESSRTALPNSVKGRETRQRMQQWARVRVPVHSVPLGYTATFADAFVNHHSHGGGHGEGITSLFDPGSGESTENTEPNRPLSITFRGNRGLAQRIIGMERAGRLPASDIGAIDAEWSGFAEGDVGRTYVEALSSARFALCPPGFVNNESFRFYEALLCGALPVEVEVALTHQGIATARGAGGIARASWRDALTDAAAMSEPDRRAAVTSARTLVQGILAGIRSGIAEDVEG